MNKVKYHKGDQVEVVRIAKSPKEYDRHIHCHVSKENPDGFKRIPAKYPTRHLADTVMMKKGFVRG